MYQGKKFHSKKRNIKRDIRFPPLITAIWEDCHLIPRCSEMAVFALFCLFSFFPLHSRDEGNHSNRNHGTGNNQRAIYSYLIIKEHTIVLFSDYNCWCDVSWQSFRGRLWFRWHAYTGEWEFLLQLSVGYVDLGPKCTWCGNNMGTSMPQGISNFTAEAGWWWNITILLLI